MFMGIGSLWSLISFWRVRKLRTQRVTMSIVMKMEENMVPRMVPPHDTDFLPDVFGCRRNSPSLELSEDLSRSCSDFTNSIMRFVVHFERA